MKNIQEHRFKMRGFLFSRYSLMLVFSAFTQSIYAQSDDVIPPKLYVFINPSFEDRPAIRGRESPLGISPANSDSTEYGFGLRRSRILLEKDWKDVGMDASFQLDVLRANELDPTNLTSKNPYLAFVSRAWVQKKWEMSKGTEIGLRLGMQDVPSHLLDNDVEHILSGMAEQFRFTPDRSDLGVSAFYIWGPLQLITSVVNGEGAKNSQNQKQTGYDWVSRFTIQLYRNDEGNGSLHLLYRKANALGLSGDACKEGTDCRPSDNHSSTDLRKDLRSLRDEYYGFESAFGYGWLDLRLGGFVIRDLEGRTQDVIPGRQTLYESDKIGWAKSIQLEFGPDPYRFISRYSYGTGSAGGLVGVEEPHGLGPWIVVPQVGSEDTRLQLNDTGRVQFANKSRFQKVTISFDMGISEHFRLAIGGEDFRSWQHNGSKTKVFVDQMGFRRTQEDFITQQTPGQSSEGIAQYLKTERRLFLRAGIWF